MEKENFKMTGMVKSRGVGSDGVLRGEGGEGVLRRGGSGEGV